jgi:predicted SAM-dependent methyltransferase
MDVTDLSVVPSGSVSEILMKSVFEHFYRHQQEPALKEYRRALKKGGRLVISSVPDFDVVIGAYLRKEKGIVGEIFDFSHVRQYVFGESVPRNQFHQLHKDIFNKESVRSLLEKNGFVIERLENVFFENQHIPLSISVTGVKE